MFGMIIVVGAVVVSELISVFAHSKDSESKVHWELSKSYIDY